MGRYEILEGVEELRGNEGNGLPRRKERKKKTSSTRDSRGIPDLSTKRARRVLTALFEMGRGVCLLGVAARDESDGRLEI